MQSFSISNYKLLFCELMLSLIISKFHSNSISVVVFLDKVNKSVAAQRSIVFLRLELQHRMFHVDNKLFDQPLLRINMEHHFELGGKEYLDNRIAWREYGDPVPTLDDAVCGLASMFKALDAGDNDRFHLETVRHREQEIQLMLCHGKKIERTAEFTVTDEQDEEYEQYHGFSMILM